MLSSQLAILVQGRGGTSLPDGQLSRRFLLDRMLDQWLHGRKSRGRSLCPFHLAFKVANHFQDDAIVNYCSWISLFRVSSGPTVPIAIKKKRREGCLRRAFPKAPPPLTRMKKKQKEEKAMIRTAMSLPGLPICRTECHSTSERGSRGEDETAVPCPTDPGSQPPNRTSFSTSFKIHSGVYRIYPQIYTARVWER